MRLKIRFLHTCFTLAVAALPLGAMAQAVEKPRIQTSALPEETAVYNPSAKKNVAQAKKNVAQTKEKPAKEQGKARASEKRKKDKKTVSVTDRRYMALKTNIAYDAIGVLNLDYEVQVHSRMTVDIPVMWSLWDAKPDKALRIAAIQPELRWWMGQETGKGHFFGLHAHVGWYNLKWDDRRYQDTGRPLVGAGLSYGYKLPLSEHWGAEFTVGFGYANMKYDTYYNIDNGAQIDTRIRHYWGPTKVGASLVYRF